MGRGDSRRTPKVLRRRGQKQLKARIARKKAEKEAGKPESQSSHTMPVEETPSPSTKVRKRSVAS